MLVSMTGYGRIVNHFDEKTITIEIRSLNSKFTDVRFKVPNNFKEREHDLRKMVSDAAQRGKLDVLVDVKSEAGDEEFGLNVPLFKRYFKELSQVTEELGAPQNDLVTGILRIPNVIAAGEEPLTDEVWQQVKRTMEEAVARFKEFRRIEGRNMEKDMVQRIANIRSNLEKINPFETTRVDKLRTRLRQNLDEFLGKENVDENRFEQEIIFYLEKIDVTEEKVRLSQHCQYFLEMLAEEKVVKGKKLNFIAQEMGREINTLGAKAYSSDIQRLVVGMKDELEKIKEMVANAV